MMAPGLVLKWFVPFVVLVEACKTSALSHHGKEKKSDDVSVSSLETLVQQQAALIQTLQSKVTALENNFQSQLTAQASRISTLENSVNNAVTSCPDGWTRFQSSCYGVGDEALTFGDAQEVCEWFGGGLAEVESSEENEFIKQLGRSGGYTGTWLGGTDIITEGHWVWLSSKEPISQGFSDWYPGQPDQGGGDQDCLVAWKAHDSYRWGDLHCFTTLQFICYKSGLFFSQLCARMKTTDRLTGVNSDRRETDRETEISQGLMEK
ncbi:hypothetical protein BaRGS_00029920 [Batillaria attramentaria]|uniref:C-type lectin domain-containing protein n=1 Tax=Batillaria attramentaria TaxID=370345 RepID=A0ABD0JUQ1_9CAEN